VDQPYSKGYAEIFAQIFDGDSLRSVTVCVDTGADHSCVDTEFVRVLRLNTEPTNEGKHHGIGGVVKANTCAKFSMKIGSMDIDVHATVIPRLWTMLMGMNTLQKYKMDVLLSKGVLKIGDLEIPLVQGPDHETITTAADAGKYDKILDVGVLAAMSLVSLMLLISFEYFSREQRLRRRMKNGEKVSRDDFLYVLQSIDREEKRDWSEHVEGNVWKDVRWEAYQRKLDVDVILEERLGRKVVTRGLYRWREKSNEQEVEKPDIKQHRNAIERLREEEEGREAKYRRAVGR